MENVYKWIMSRHPQADLVELGLGLGSEAGEVEQLARNAKFDGKAVRDGDVILELSDVWHYLMLGCAVYGVTLEDLEAVNRRKMQARDAGYGRRYEDAIRGWCREDGNLSSLAEMAGMEVESLIW